MYIKSTLVAALAFAASVSAQAKTVFTSPVGGSQVYSAGSNQTFTWLNNCVAPSNLTATDPTKVPVQLLNATVATNAFFLKAITTVDCSTGNQGNVAWTVPTLDNYDGLFSLQMVFIQGNAYSGSFKITPPAGTTTTTAPPATTTTAPPSSGANGVAPALSGAAAAVAVAAMLL
ncbi:hypothetical protein BGZ80_002489 [Entomortierella chlamydospora]|uniref:Uncharacterized protein n=1 Tax=Entomortierella chlamydospora TaxID=101097 RepID=A0A9P6SX32_9FUNG|nr:hypothetical protein BGZ79_002059 [Entomortierella chlamydospora]KAG0009342.1 hypothetical protein BGZ80_002489 [Entomortierella chlamydospora]